MADFDRSMSARAGINLKNSKGYSSIYGDVAPQTQAEADTARTQASWQQDANDRTARELRSSYGQQQDAAQQWGDQQQVQFDLQGRQTLNRLGQYANSTQSQFGAYGQQAADTGSLYGGRATEDYAAQQQARQAGMSNLDRLSAYAQQGPGPSAAEAQLRMSSDQNMANAIAMSRSGRGAGANAFAQRQAMAQNAATQQQTAAQMATLRAQEADAWRGRQLEAMGQVQAGAANLRGQDISTMGANQGMGATYANLAQGYQSTGAQLAQGYRSAGESAAQGYANTGAQLATQGQQLGQGYAQLGGSQALAYKQLGQNAYQFGETERQAVLANQLQSNTSRANQLSQERVGMTGITAENERAYNAAQVAGMGAMMSMMGGMAKAGDGGGGGAAAAKEPSTEASDVRVKTAIAPARGDVQDTFRKLDAYSYDYRDPSMPGAAPGRHYGPMAQELEQSPAGASVVEDSPTGKRVDAGRLAMLNASATAQHQRRLDELDATLERLGAYERDDKEKE